MSAEFVAINGQIFKPEDAKISVFDRGFLYGDAIYEVTRSYGRILFQLEAHLDRLWRSAEGIGMDLGIRRENLIEEIYEVVNRTGSENQYMRVQISRGAGPISLAPDASTGTTRVIYVKPLKPFSPAHYSTGVEIAISPVWRNSRRAMDPNIKSGNYLNNILAIQSRIQAPSPHEVLMINSAGQITEGTTSNIFLVKNGTVVTPPDDSDILWGITRSLVLRLANQLKIRTELRGFQPAELKAADEVFLTSSTREVMPVASIDGSKVANSPGPITKQLMSLFKEQIQDYCESAKARHPWKRGLHV